MKNNLDLMLNLIKLYLPADKAPTYLTYFQRILSSKPSSKSDQDTKHILNLISRRVSPGNFQRVTILCKKLENNQNISKAKSILLTILKLSEDKSEHLLGNPLISSKLLTHTPQILPPESPDPKPKISIETTLIRDILFTFQGIEGTYLHFSSLDDRFVVRKELPDSVKYTLECLSEIGWLYKKIIKYIVNYENYPSIVCQGFCAALKSELKEYYRLIALLEGQIHSKLKQIELWCEEPLERMRWLAITCDAVEGLTGGNFISAVFSYSKYGNPAVRVLINRILDSVSEQYIKIIESWMQDGELCDTFHEFFVEENEEVSKDQLWAKKYHLIKDLAPAFFSPELIDQVFLTGKSINFIRKCCLEQWKSEGPLELPKLRDMASMKIWIETSSSLTNSKLIKILLEKYRFIEYSKCIRKYLLMAQGDFHHYLMEQLNEVLNEPARKIFAHNLVSIRENAIRSSNAQNDDLELLNKLSIRLEEYNTLDIGWDVFVLNYQIDAPLNSIYTEQVMASYTRVFKLLWRIKRVHFYMNSFQNEREMVKLQNMKGVEIVLHKCQMLRLEIMHFVNNLCHYLMVEVQEGAWNNFMNSVYNIEDLDKLIQSHQKFLDIILDRAFLSQENDRIYKKLLKLLGLSLDFKLSQETLINSAIEEYQRRVRLRYKIDDTSEFYSLPRISNESINDIERISIKFSEEIQIFRKLLSEADKTHLRFLAFRLDFNEYYTNKTIRDTIY